MALPVCRAKALHGSFEGRLGGLLGSQRPHAQRVLPRGQIKLRIQRMQAVHPRRPVAQPFDPHLTEHGGQPALVQALLGALHRVGPAYRSACRPRSAAVHLRLEQHPHQLPAALCERSNRPAAANRAEETRGAFVVAKSNAALRKTG